MVLPPFWGIGRFLRELVMHSSSGSARRIRALSQKVFISLVRPESVVVFQVHLTCKQLQIGWVNGNAVHHL